MESEDTSNVLQNVKVETIRCASTQRSLPNSINMVGKIVTLVQVAQKVIFIVKLAFQNSV